MRIAFVRRGMYPEWTGGTYSYLYEFGRRMAERGHEIVVIASTDEGAAEPPHDFAGMRIHEYAVNKIHPLVSMSQHLRISRRVFEELAAERPFDVLSVQDLPIGVSLVKGHAGRSVCQIPTFHAPTFLEFRFDTEWKIRAERSPLRRTAIRSTERFYENWQHRFETIPLETADGIVVLSEYSRSHIENHFSTVDLGKVRIVPGGVDTERFRPADDRESVRAALGIPPEEVHLLTVRRLVPRMGLENLVRAMRTVLDSDPARGLDVRLTICGSGRLRATLEGLAAELGVDSAVTLAGRVTDEDLVRRYQAADLFVLPTAAMEGFGIVTVEALATNTPVVGTPAGATPEILSAVDERLLTRDTSDSAIADAIISWLAWRREDEGTTRYRDEVLAKYTWDRVTDLLESYYAEMLDRFRSERERR